MSTLLLTNLATEKWPSERKWFFSFQSTIWIYHAAGMKLILLFNFLSTICQHVYVVCQFVQALILEIPFRFLAFWNDCKYLIAHHSLLVQSISKPEFVRLVSRETSYTLFSRKPTIYSRFMYRIFDIGFRTCAIRIWFHATPCHRFYLVF